MRQSISSQDRWRSWIRIAPVALTFVLGAATMGHAATTCDDQKGKVIFEDTFADDTGGWDSDVDASFSGSKLALHLQPKFETWTYYNSTFNASEADYCVEAILPQSVAPDNSVALGIVFWGTDLNNLFLFQILSDAKIQLYKRSAGTWQLIADLSNPDVKPAPGSIVTIRVQAMGNVIAPSINGVALRKTRAQMPTGNLKFGLHI